MRRTLTLFPVLEIAGFLFIFTGFSWLGKIRGLQLRARGGKVGPCFWNVFRVESVLECVDFATRESAFGNGRIILSTNVSVGYFFEKEGWTSFEKMENLVSLLRIFSSFLFPREAIILNFAPSHWCDGK